MLITTCRKAFYLATLSFWRKQSFFFIKLITKALKLCFVMRLWQRFLKRFQLYTLFKAFSLCCDWKTLKAFFVKSFKTDTFCYRNRSKFVWKLNETKNLSSCHAIIFQSVIYNVKFCKTCDDRASAKLKHFVQQL